MAETKTIYSHRLLCFSLVPSECCFPPCRYRIQSDRRIHCSQTHCFNARAAHHHRHLADLSQSRQRAPSQVPHRPQRSEVGINHTQNNKNLITTPLWTLWGRKYAGYKNLAYPCVFYSVANSTPKLLLFRRPITWLETHSVLFSLPLSSLPSSSLLFLTSPPGFITT